MLINHQIGSFTRVINHRTFHGGLVRWEKDQTKWFIFQNAMFDYQRVTIKNWDAIFSQKAIWLWIKTFRIDW
jgi:hypothetical protein